MRKGRKIVFCGKEAGRSIEDDDGKLVVCNVTHGLG